MKLPTSVPKYSRLYNASDYITTYTETKKIITHVTHEIRQLAGEKPHPPELLCPPRGEEKHFTPPSQNDSGTHRFMGIVGNGVYSSIIDAEKGSRGDHKGGHEVVMMGNWLVCG
jgi:hypothetical protein